MAEEKEREEEITELEAFLRWELPNCADHLENHGGDNSFTYGYLVMVNRAYEKMHEKGLVSLESLDVRRYEMLEYLEHVIRSELGRPAESGSPSGLAEKINEGGVICDADIKNITEAIKLMGVYIGKISNQSPPIKPSKSSPRPEYFNETEYIHSMPDCRG